MEPLEHGGVVPAAIRDIDAEVAELEGELSRIVGQEDGARVDYQAAARLQSRIDELARRREREVGRARRRAAKGARLDGLRRRLGGIVAGPGTRPPEPPADAAPTPDGPAPAGSDGDEPPSPAVAAIDAEVAELAGELSRLADQGGEGGPDYQAAARLQSRIDELARRREREVGRARRRAARRARLARLALKATHGGRAADGPGDDDGPLPCEFVPDPEGPQRLVPFEMLFRDGIMELGDGGWSLTVSYTDTNYLLARELDKEVMNGAYQGWLNSLGEGERVQVSLMSRHTDARTYERDFELKPREGDADGNTYRSELNAYIRGRLTSSTASLRRELSVTFTVRAEGHDDAARRLATLVRGFDRFCRRFGSSHRVLTGQERMDLICSVTKPDDEAGKYTYDSLALGMRMRDLACPWRVLRPDGGRGDSRLVVGGRWVRSYTLLPADGGWGSTQRDTFVSDLVGTGHDMIVSWHVVPWVTSAAVSAANRQYLDVSDENVIYRINNSKPERGYFIDETNMPRKMVEAEKGAKQVREELVKHRQRMFSVSLVVTLISRDEEGLADACRDVEAVFHSHQKPGVESWSSIREQCYTSSLPLGLNQVPYVYHLMTRPLSCLMPFMANEFMDRGGLLLGVNADTNALLMYSRERREQTNAFILGQSGAGKSVVAKLLQLQIHLKEPMADQIILDPEGEYVAGVERLGGQVVRISESSDDHVNPLDISPYYASAEPSQQTRPLPAKVSFVEELVEKMTHGITEEEGNALDAACERAYERWLETRADEDVPTLSDLVDELGRMGGAMAGPAAHLSALLWRYTSGTSDFFDHRTNVDLQSNLVDFSLVDMRHEFKPLAMMVLLDQIWVRVTRNRAHGRRTYLWIDEIQILIDDPLTLHTVDVFWARGRKWDLYNTGITQNLSRVLDVFETSYMMDNSPMAIVMRQSAEAAERAADTFKLSDDQRDVLFSARDGEGVAIIGNQAVHFDFGIDAEEYPLLYRFVTTTPDDLREERRQARTSLRLADGPQDDGMTSRDAAAAVGEG